MPFEGHGEGHTFAREFILTYLTVLVVFGTAFDLIPEKEPDPTVKVQQDNLGLTLYTTNPQSRTGFAPIAIGLTVTVTNSAGGVADPARAFGTAIARSESFMLHGNWE